MRTTDETGEPSSVSTYYEWDRQALRDGRFDGEHTALAELTATRARLADAVATDPGGDAG